MTKRKIIALCVCFVSTFMAGRTICLAQESVTEKQQPVFKVGFAKCDITPTEPVPMWGYGDRHGDLSKGVMDPLFAKAIVIEVAADKLAIVGLDLGRAPTAAMMVEIRKMVSEQAGVSRVLISGSHTHHGPVIELTDAEGFGKGKFDAAVAYSAKLPSILAKTIIEAAGNVRPARLATASKKLERFNRNRHSKREPKVTDSTLTVMKFDDETGKSIAVLVNFAAHPTMVPSRMLKFSADYPGHMQRWVESQLSTNCVFIQAAAGDMSVNTEAASSNPKEFGQALGDQVIKLAKTIRTRRPKNPSIKSRVDSFTFKTRIDFHNPLINLTYSQVFFPELIQNLISEWADGIRCEMTTVLLNGNVAMVGVPGEFFCNHSNRFRERAYTDSVLFFGYCNGYCSYFPTIEATSEGGYGAEPRTAPVQVGAGERMMDRALINIYDMMGKYDKEKSGAGLLSLSGSKQKLKNLGSSLVGGLISGQKITDIEAAQNKKADSK